MRPALVRYFVAFLLGELAASILTIAIMWSVWQIHHQAFDLGLVGLAMFLPNLALVLVTGHVADRYERKRTLLAIMLIEAILAFGLAALVFFGVRELTVVLVVVAALGTIRAFSEPIEGTILVAIVSAEEYLSVQARYSSVRELVMIAAPAFGGALVAVSPVVAMAVSGGAAVVVAALFSSIPVPRHAVDGDEKPSLASALQGVRFIVSRPIVLGAISLDLFAVLFGGATALLPIFADRILHAGAIGYGLLRASSGIGAGACAFVLSRRPPARKVGRTLLLAVGIYGAAMLAFSASRQLWLSIVARAAAAAADMVSVVIRTGLVQLNTPDAMRGRVIAVEMVFVGASNQLGAFESGTLAQFVGAVPAVAIGGAATLAVVGVWSALVPALRRSDRVVAQPP